MIYGYIRISTGKQETMNQKFEIERFATANNLTVDGWIEETISGTKNYDKRKLGDLLKHVKKDDIIICTELSRLGRSLFMIMNILNICMEKECLVWTIKDNYRLGEGVTSTVLAFAFGLAAEVERNMISERTKLALARKKEMGVQLGRPKGSLNKKVKLSGKEDAIRILISEGHSISKISRLLHCDRSTLTRFIKNHMSEQENPNYPATKNDIEKTVV